MSLDKDTFDELGCDILGKLRCLFYDFIQCDRHEEESTRYRVGRQVARWDGRGGELLEPVRSGLSKNCGQLQAFIAECLLDVSDVRTAFEHTFAAA